MFVVAALLALAQPPPGYDRVVALPKRFASAHVGGTVAAHWEPEGAHFWYSAERGDGRREFVRVAVADGAKAPAFDHAALATALANAANRPVDATRLPFKQLEFVGETIRFNALGRAWTYDRTANRVTPRPAEALPPRRDQPKSRADGEPTVVTFRNRSEVALQLVWIDTDGQRHDYAKLAVGDDREQPTFAGHAWALTAPDGTIRAVFVAADGASVATVNANTPRPGTPSRAGHDSPDGRWRAIIQRSNVAVQDRRDGTIHRLSQDGRADDAYREPLVWSPDSTRLVARQERAGDHRQIHLIESSPRDQLQPKLHTLHYDKPGDRLPVPRVRLFDVVERKPIAVDESSMPNAWSIDHIHWQPDSSAFHVLFNERGHQLLRVVGIDTRSGATRTIIEERSKTFIDYAGKLYLQPLPKTHQLLWMSERSGWNHLYRINDRTGEVVNPVTAGPWCVLGVERLDEAAGHVTIRMGGFQADQDPYHVNFARVNLDGSGFTPLTAGDGTHALQWSPDGRHYLDTYSRVDQPPITELRRAADGSRVSVIEHGDDAALRRLGWQPPIRFHAPGRDGKALIYGVLFRPTGFAPTRRYPVLERVYAGPQSAYAPKAFSTLAGAQAMAELGVVVVQADGMGTSHRSKPFHDVCWQNLADAGFPDRIAWLKAAAREYPWLDLSRVGLYGGSAGGQNAVRGLLDHGDFYTCAAADCGCHDNRMDKVWWNELWMGYPVGPHYARQSNATDVGKLRQPLLLTVGELDRNVDPASTMQLANALIRAGKRFELLVMPGAGHGAGELPYAARRRAEFFERHLLGPAGGPP